ncbi:RrF2 family transcriptional regulator [Salinarimonas ramus]|uniref:DNA-binding protein n=1 Tax=Salinarimonas ramus TaxID=690164 RepID=A0A917Q4J2_9HYPH|nr:Rrf2 family transcriptional regulator [Salinarimonas ramus]GGK20766.1 DNA-binding protein [Salinarimonas ramus]
MKLTVHTDYALRVLMTLAVLDERIVTIEELARRHRISENHLRKVAQTLIRMGLVAGVRGRAGGLRLAVDPAGLRMGGVVRALEEDMSLVECLGEGPAGCALAGACRLTGALARALEAFLAELDRITLADLAGLRPAMRARLGIEGPGRSPL